MLNCLIVKYFNSLFRYRLCVLYETVTIPSLLDKFEQDLELTVPLVE